MTSKNFFLVVFSCEIVALLDVAGQEYIHFGLWRVPTHKIGITLEIMNPI